MNPEKDDDLGTTMQHIIPRCADECKISRREIELRSGNNKDTLNRKLAGTRSIALENALNIEIATGRDPHEASQLIFYNAEDLASLWREPKDDGFMSEPLGSVPNALRNRLVDNVEELRPGWGAGAAKRAVTAVGRTTADRLKFEQAFGLMPIPKFQRKPRRRPATCIKAM